jgi:hypothetical protein
MAISGCSSAPEKIYQVDEYSQASIDYMKLADRKRQQENYSEALNLYLPAEKYALKRNDQFTISISKLKRAQINITLQKFSLSEDLIKSVEQANEVERLGLTPSINFIKAKLLFNNGKKSEALILISQLENYYRTDIERHAYYQILRWSYDYQQIKLDIIRSNLEILTARFDNKSLNNIEILSFAHLEFARWAAEYADLDIGKNIIDNAIKHFSLLELTPKIARISQFAANFYSRHHLTDKASYYKNLYQQLSPQ